jgi:citrate synthase
VFITSQEACRILGVKPATLYTYVSRGLLHPTAGSGRKASLYLLEEIEDLRARSEARMGHGAVAASALRWGQPVIDTAITEITPQGPRYRGHLALDLAREPGVFEEVAELLWSGALPEKRTVWTMPKTPAHLSRVLHEWGADRQATVPQVLSIVCTALDATASGEERIDESDLDDARRLLRVFAGCCGLLGPRKRMDEVAGKQSVAQALAAALGVPGEPQLLSMLNAMLILCADHELSPPTFSARVAASVGASLNACIAAALAAHSGSGMGGGCDRLEAMVDDASSTAHWQDLMAPHVSDRVLPPGFGLASYPQGDPRAAYMLDLARKHPAPTPKAERLFKLVDTVQAQMGVAPRLEAGLVAVCAAWDLPPRSAGALWAIGRTAGWVAHVLEQRQHGFFLRPRGQFRPA